MRKGARGYFPTDLEMKTIRRGGLEREVTVIEMIGAMIEEEVVEGTVTGDNMKKGADPVLEKKTLDDVLHSEAALDLLRELQIITVQMTVEIEGVTNVIAALTSPAIL